MFFLFHLSVFRKHALTPELLQFLEAASILPESSELLEMTALLKELGMKVTDKVQAPKRKMLDVEEKMKHLPSCSKMRLEHELPLVVNSLRINYVSHEELEALWGRKTSENVPACLERLSGLQCESSTRLFLDRMLMAVSTESDDGSMKVEVRVKKEDSNKVEKADYVLFRGDVPRGFW